MLKSNLSKATNATSPNPLCLICTTKENGHSNLATVSWYTYLSFNPEMMAFAMSKASYSGEMIRKNKKAILVIPGSALAEISMQCGTSTGFDTDKVEEFNIPLTQLETSNIKIPSNSKVAIELSLKEYVETGDHYLYICNVDNVYENEDDVALFAWNGYSLIKPVE